MRKIGSYFLQGLILIAPIVITAYIIYKSVLYLDSIVPVNFPGLGIAIVLVGLTLIGFLSSTFIFRPIFRVLERIIQSTPLVKIIYTALRDLFSAFMGDEGRFKQPVIVQLNTPSELHRLGFVTKEDLSDIDINEMVAVYIPHSYQISGNLFIVPRDNVRKLEGVSSTQVMKFIVSGGVTQIGALKQKGSHEED